MTDLNPLIVGEVLFDVFPGNKKVLGGAPFNVAWHLTGFGLSPQLLSRVGKDENGQNILDVMQSWHMATDLVQLDDTAPTGTVDIQLDSKGHHSFSIPDNQAWDHLSWCDELASCNQNHISWLYHGSLALRHSHNGALLERLRAPGVPVFMDVNLRNPWWDKDSTCEMMRHANWVKINDEEFIQLTDPSKTAPDWRESIPGLHHEYALDGLIVTCGADGAWIFDGKELIFKAPDRQITLQDTVGAGDAFTAVCILGLSRNWSVSRILNRALDFAAGICEIRGATTNKRGFYENYIQQWQSGEQL